MRGPTEVGNIGGSRRESYEEKIETLKRSLQEQRRATTLLNAEVQRQTEAREALEAQLIEANAEIAASWDRRKEMTRVIVDREAKLEELRAEVRAANERRKEISRVVADRDAKIAHRDARIAELKAEVQARYEELAALQQHIARSSLSARVRRLMRPIARIFR